MKHYNLLGTLIFISAFVVVLPSSIRPIFATTLELNDQILRLNTCIFKNMTLPFGKEFYEARDINVVAGISQMSMDDNFVYQIRYQILCPLDVCIIDFALSRLTQVVSEQTQYSLTIDFLVAENIAVATFNMTSLKSDFNLEILKGLVGKESQDLEVFLVPNGFNNITLTGFIDYKFLPNSNKIIIEYDQKQDKAEWGINTNFILLKLFIIPKKDIQQTQQSMDCKNKPFKAFLSTKLSKISMNKNNKQANNQYAYLDLALDCDTQFVDNRIVKLQLAAQQSRNSTDFIFLIIPFLLAELGYTLYKKRQTQLGVRSQVQMPDMLISFHNSSIISSKTEELQTQTETDKKVEE